MSNSFENIANFVCPTLQNSFCRRGWGNGKNGGSRHLQNQFIAGNKFVL